MLVDTLRRTMPLVASAALLITLAVCLALTLAMGRYIGGLKLPYFSDMGRGMSLVPTIPTQLHCHGDSAVTSVCVSVWDHEDPPSYYVFGIGLTIIAVAIFMTWILNCVYQSASLRLRIHRGLLRKSTLVWSALVVVLGVFSTPGLPILVRIITLLSTMSKT